MNLALEAMIFARSVHKNQRRKYTGNPYTDHLAEVAGIVATVDQTHESIATAWLHDCMEDHGVTWRELESRFGLYVANGVLQLSDLETGNRVERKAASRSRLSLAVPWIQTIKLADLISNTSSIVQHDPKFAQVYLAEKRALLAVLKYGNQHLHAMASEMAQQA